MISHRICIALVTASALFGAAGCGTQTYPDNVLEGTWRGDLTLSGSLKVGDELQNLDPAQRPFTITFGADGVPKLVPNIGDGGSQSGFDLRDFRTPGQTQSSSVDTADTTGTVTVTCLEAEFSESAMRYVVKLEVASTVHKSGADFASNSVTMTTLTAEAIGQTCHFVNNTVTTGNGPVETPAQSGMFVDKTFETILHAEGDLGR